MMQWSPARLALFIGVAMLLVFILAGRPTRERAGQTTPDATLETLRLGSVVEERTTPDTPRPIEKRTTAKHVTRTQSVYLGDVDTEGLAVKAPVVTVSPLYKQGPVKCQDPNACDCPPDFGLPQPTREYRGFTVWSSDYHIATIGDLKDVFKRMDWDVKVVDKSLSGHCHLTHSCQTDLKVFPSGSALDMPCGTAKGFWDAYRNDPLMQKVDAMACTYSIGMCEAFMPFNKTLIIVVPTRFEVGRFSQQRWSNLIKNLRKMAENPRNIIAANNVFDQMYVRYFTGLGDRVVYIPSFCGYTGAVWSNKNKQVLISPRHLMGHNSQLAQELIAHANGKNSGYTFARQDHVYQHYEFSQLAEHPAIVLLPYQVSLMSFFEYYRMGIPMFSPSKRLYARWHIQHGTFEQLTWNRVHGHPEDHSVVPIHRCAQHEFKSDPNNERSAAAMEEWFAFSDYEAFPHLMYFDSWDDIFPQLNQENLKAVHQKMMEFNKKQEKDIIDQWKSLFERSFHGMNPGESVMPSGSFDDATRALFGPDFKIFPEC